MTRTVSWLFAISTALFVCGIGFIVASGRTAQNVPEAPERPSVTPVATIAQIMNGIVMPNATVVYESVGSNVTAAGLVEIAPKNDEEWARVGDSAAALVESGNLLLIGDRALDNGEWVRMTRAFMAAADASLKAAAQKNVDGMFMSGGDLAVSCDKCHERYQRR